MGELVEQMISLEVPDLQNTLHKVNLLRDRLIGKKVLVAFSGGVDSSVVAFIAREHADSAVLVMQTGTSVPLSEIALAENQAKQLELPLRFVNYDEVDLSLAYGENDEQRCFYCKDLLYSKLEEIRKQLNYDLVLSGTNFSDLKGHRPGYQSALKHKVLNPLVVAKLTKVEVRLIARVNGLHSAEKPATACLASRIMTGVTITKQRLRRIEELEEYIKQTIYPYQLRVRDHGEFARIEVDISSIPKLEDAWDDVLVKCKKHGFLTAVLDQEGYRPSMPNSVKINS